MTFPVSSYYIYSGSFVLQNLNFRTEQGEPFTSILFGSPLNQRASFREQSHQELSQILFDPSCAAHQGCLFRGRTIPPPSTFFSQIVCKPPFPWILLALLLSSQTCFLVLPLYLSPDSQFEVLDTQTMFGLKYSSVSNLVYKLHMSTLAQLYFSLLHRLAVLPFLFLPQSLLACLVSLVTGHVHA